MLLHRLFKCVGFKVTQQPRSGQSPASVLINGYRNEYSPLAAFFYSEIDPLNQVIHIWLPTGSSKGAILEQENKILFAAPLSPVQQRFLSHNSPFSRVGRCSHSCGTTWCSLKIPMNFAVRTENVGFFPFSKIFRLWEKSIDPASPGVNI